MIKEINKENSEKAEWEFFLHKVFDKNWQEFKDELNAANDNTPFDLNGTVGKSKEMLTNFIPTE